jgi:hypothetical protein
MTYKRYAITPKTKPNSNWCVRHFTKVQFDVLYVSQAKYDMICCTFQTKSNLTCCMFHKQNTIWYVVHFKQSPIWRVVCFTNKIRYDTLYISNKFRAVLCIFKAVCFEAHFLANARQWSCDENRRMSTIGFSLSSWMSHLVGKQRIAPRSHLILRWQIWRGRRPRRKHVVLGISKQSIASMGNADSRE